MDLLGFPQAAGICFALCRRPAENAWGFTSLTPGTALNQRPTCKSILILQCPCSYGTTLRYNVHCLQNAPMGPNRPFSVSLVCAASFLSLTHSPRLSSSFLGSVSLRSNIHRNLHFTVAPRNPKANVFFFLA